MRFASWNCRTGGLVKWKALAERGVDVAVLCETELANPAAVETFFDVPLHWVATGEPKKAVAVASSARLNPLPVRSAGRRWCTVALSSSGPTVVGIHSLPTGGRGPNYEDEVMACLLDWADDISRGDAIVAGDFNIGPDVADPAKKAFVERAAALWSELGLVSAYHHFFDEDLLAPSRPTHYWRYNPAAAWHIDYVLLPRSRIDRLRGRPVFANPPRSSLSRQSQAVSPTVMVDRRNPEPQSID